MSAGTPNCENSEGGGEGPLIHFFQFFLFPLVFLSGYFFSFFLVHAWLVSY